MSDYGYDRTTPPKRWGSPWDPEPLKRTFYPIPSAVICADCGELYRHFEDALNHKCPKDDGK